MRRFLLAALILPTVALTAQAQWQLQQSHTTASLRGIHALGNGVAWAFRTEGTVLHTTDDGATWQPCAIPPNAEHLDFRGIQAFDAQTAIVMSSGKGDLSRLYKTTDACQTWKLVFTNPDKEGFWDAIKVDRRGRQMILIGDPVNDHFFLAHPNLDSSPPQQGIFKHRPSAHKEESLFAASNSSVFVEDAFFNIWIGTGGASGARVIKRINHDFDSFGFDSFPSVSVPIGSRTESSGIFSLAFRHNLDSHAHDTQYTVGIAVGGDYKEPDLSINTAAITADGGRHWLTPITPPHGYRSAVAYSPTHKAWITVGPNGTDLSTDDGRTWRPLKPTAPNADPEEDQHWNALSLPFVVGPKGRIGKLREQVLQP